MLIEMRTLYPNSNVMKNAHRPSLYYRDFRQQEQQTRLQNGHRPPGKDKLHMKAGSQWLSPTLLSEKGPPLSQVSASGGNLILSIPTSYVKIIIITISFDMLNKKGT